MKTQTLPVLELTTAPVTPVSVIKIDGQPYRLRSRTALRNPLFRQHVDALRKLGALLQRTDTAQNPPLGEIRTLLTGLMPFVVQDVPHQVLAGLSDDDRWAIVDVFIGQFGPHTAMTTISTALPPARRRSKR